MSAIGGTEPDLPSRRTRLTFGQFAYGPLGPHLTVMTQLNRRTFLAAAAAAGTVRTMPTLATRPPMKRVLTLVYDKSIGAMRAVDRIVR